MIKCLILLAENGKQMRNSSLSYRNAHNDVIRMSLMLFILFLVFFRIVNYLLLPPKAKLNTKKATTTSHNITTHEPRAVKRNLLSQVSGTNTTQKQQRRILSLKSARNAHKKVKSKSTCSLFYFAFFISIGNGRIDNLNIHNCRNNYKC